MSEMDYWFWISLFASIEVFFSNIENLMMWCGRRRFARARPENVDLVVAVMCLFLSWSPYFVGEGSAWIWSLLLLAGWFQSVRAGGMQNGGSDTMSLYTRLALVVGSTDVLGDATGDFCLLFLAALVTCSYVVSGIAKAKQRGWWTGRYLAYYVSSSVYRDSGTLICVARQKPSIAWSAGTLAVLCFEFGFPLLFCIDGWAYPILAGGILFHAINAYVLGLPRFFWAWVATYPAVLYAATTTTRLTVRALGIPGVFG